MSIGGYATGGCFEPPVSSLPSLESKSTGERRRTPVAPGENEFHCVTEDGYGSDAGSVRMNSQNHPSGAQPYQIHSPLVEQGGTQRSPLGSFSTLCCVSNLRGDHKQNYFFRFRPDRLPLSHGDSFYEHVPNVKKKHVFYIDMRQKSM